MKRIVYFCPNLATPTGGIKVMHRHSELINQIGGNSSVYYHVGLKDNKIDWFSHAAKIKTDTDFIPGQDFVVLPEAMIYSFWRELKDCNVEYGIFIQNGYFVQAGISENELDDCYSNAKFLICISEDAINCVFKFFPDHIHKIVRVSTSVDKETFRIRKKKKVITYMPRKAPDHSNFLIPMLRRRLPAEWQIMAIENMSEAEVATVLSGSQIFLAFTDFEGLGLPPVEAALSGNFVIGYTGQGGKEFWNRPIFYEIESGDLSEFLDVVLEKVSSIENNNLVIAETHLTFLSELFSKETELKMLKGMLQRVCEN